MKYTALAEEKKNFRSVFYLINSTLRVLYDIKKKTNKHLSATERNKGYSNMIILSNNYIGNTMATIFHLSNKSLIKIVISINMVNSSIIIKIVSLSNSLIVVFFFALPISVCTSFS